MASSKRGPSVLVTDARERPPTRGAPHRPGTAGGGPGRMPNMRFMTVDNVLQYASEIPSGQPRVPPGPRPQRVGQGPAWRGSLGGGGGGSGTGGGLPILASARTGQQNVPSRTTKVSEKLVLIPEMVDDQASNDDKGDDDDDDTAGSAFSRADDLEAARQAALLQAEEDGPLRDEELDVLRRRGGIRGKSYAERLPKPERADKVSRLTAYCTAQAYKMKATAEFLRTKHEAKAKLYDDCLYTAYHLPLLPGVDGHRVRSRPILKTPGTGKTALDLEIERSERRDEHEGYFDEYASYGVRDAGHDGGSLENGSNLLRQQQANGASKRARNRHHEYREEEEEEEEDEPPLSPIHRLAPDAQNLAEMFVFSYGVVVFWNFTEHQEKDILADLTFAQSATGVSLVTRPLDQADVETEEFHFEYSADVERPRVFNDMITLLPRSDHMVKLTISHAIAQSTKLCFFEERMSETMLDAEHVPKRLALTGELNMTRTEIVKILGRLFKSRVDINLSSNILDVPNFFWDSEPTLHPLYVAIREYLEIDPRTKVLNERCRVFLDLAEILSDSVADSKMSSITWIVIILIVVSILITVTEVLLRFGMLEKNKGGGGPVGGCEDAGGVGGQLRGLDLSLAEQMTLEEVRLWSAVLSDRQRAEVCGVEHVGKTFAGV